MEKSFNSFLVPTMPIQAKVAARPRARRLVSVRGNGKFRKAGTVAQARFSVEGQLETRKLATALQAFAGQREFLRTVFRASEENGRPEPIVLPAKISCTEHDCSSLEPEMAENWIQSLSETEWLQSLSRNQASLLRCVVVRTAEERCQLILTFHATLMSVNDSGQLVRDLLAADAAIKNGSGHASSPVPRIANLTEIATRWKKISEMESESADAMAKATWEDALFFPDTAQPQESEAIPTGRTRKIIIPLERKESETAQDSIELELTRLWKSVLKIQRVERGDDFFKLGGHSLMAAKLLSRIYKSFNKELSLASLLEAPTIELQAELIRGTEKERNTSPDAGTATLPFFLFGGYATFLTLVECLRSETTLHSIGLQPSLIKELDDPKSLACMAAAFIEKIRERQPTGPYSLGGWCSHGLLALEAARQLRAQGESVPLVVLIETPNPVAQQAYAPWKRGIARLQLKWNLMEFEIAYLRRVGARQAWNHIEARVSKKIRKLRSSLRSYLAAIRTHEETGNPPPKDPFDVLYAAGEAYRPVPYDGKVVLFRSKKKSFGFAGDLRMGWDNLLGERFEIREIPGNHFSIYLDQNAQVLAKEIGNCLREAQAHPETVEHVLR